jgi:hypothetical protein
MKHKKQGWHLALRSTETHFEDGIRLNTGGISYIWGVADIWRRQELHKTTIRDIEGNIRLFYLFFSSSSVFLSCLSLILFSPEIISGLNPVRSSHWQLSLTSYFIKIFLFNYILLLPPWCMYVLFLPLGFFPQFSLNSIHFSRGSWTNSN